MAWTDFDHPWPVTLLRAGRDDMDGSGQLLKGTPTTTAITGSFDPSPRIKDSEDEVRRQAGGLIAQGEAFFFTETQLFEGDVLRIAHDASGSPYTDYRVMGPLRSMGWFHVTDGSPVRQEYRLQKVEVE